MVVQRTTLIVALLLSHGAAFAAEPAVSYQRDIQPLLSDACYRCHGPDAASREAELRLDQRDDALKPAASHLPAIVPGEPDQSELLRRILSDDPAIRMPPPEAQRQLTARDKQRLRDWIAAGAKYDRHWSFVPIQRSTLPKVSKANWCRNSLDLFVLAKLEEADLPAAPPADATTLLRRISFSLTGLPPSPTDTETLLAASNQSEIEQILAADTDRLLSSPQYGEQWARHWMDLVRYADSAGYELDFEFDHSWRYRDWLIRSFQSNKPLNRFLEEQLAGDQLWPDSEDARTGTLFLAIGPRRFEGGIRRDDEREYEWLTDVADTTGSAFLGMTWGCARCHDHKFDPLSQKDYFGLQAIFGETRLDETRLGENKSETSPASLRVVSRDRPTNVQILRRGEISQPLGPAVASLPAVLPNGGPLTEDLFKQRRTALAQWVTSPQNPLTARVLVNRIWIWHFGKGLVRTPSDFGLQGSRPTHPELLDWLASELIASGWDLKHLHRLIIDSATFRMSSTVDPAIQLRDPDHLFLTRFPRRRLQAEELQDSMRFVAGRLNLQSFGPPIVPPLESWALAGLRNSHWQSTTDDAAVQRRGVYMVVRRSMKLPFFEAFNGPDTVNSCAARDSTTTPLQSLTLLNSPESLANARALAAGIWDESHGDESQAAKIAWIRLFARTIRKEELQVARQFLIETRAATSSNHFLPDAWIAWVLILLNSSEFSYVD